MKVFPVTLLFSTPEPRLASVVTKLQCSIFSERTSNQVLLSTTWVPDLDSIVSRRRIRVHAFLRLNLAPKMLKP